jgi:uncharacterized protein
MGKYSWNITGVEMQFEWDPRKAAINLRKHSVSFVEAATVFQDDLSLTGNDPDHSDSEDRYVTFGISGAGRLLVVSYSERGNRVRIISARTATRSERNLYEEG